MRRLIRTLKHESEDAMRTGGLLLAGGALATMMAFCFAAAIVAGVSTFAPLFVGFIAAGVFLAICAFVCWLVAGEEEDAPVDRRSSAHPHYSDTMRLVEDVASGFIGRAHQRDAKKTLAVAMTVGAVLGVLETLEKR